MAALNLSADQKTKLKSIHDREKTEMDALRSNTSLSADQRRTQAKAIHEKYGAERKAILTPEQQQKAAQFREQWKDRRGDRDTVHGRRSDGQARGDKGARGERGERFQKMQQELNLTADQQQRMKAIRDQYRPQLEAIRQDQSLTQEQKKARSKELFKAQSEQMKAVLTPAQQEKMKSMRKGKGRKARTLPYANPFHSPHEEKTPALRGSFLFLPDEQEVWVREVSQGRPQEGLGPEGAAAAGKEGANARAQSVF
ncbi:MAG: hypothetical protein EOO12_16460 [Chitinophagaceae bacterium]|nr:MAG: hypothetical protein EOO12_16460 [Chitinophagaceae bacterium]